MTSIKYILYYYIMSSINFNFSPARDVFSPASAITNSIENVTGIFDKIMGIAILLIFAVVLLVIFIFGPGEPIPQYGIPPGRRIGKIYKGAFFKNIIPSWYKEYTVYEQRTGRNTWTYYLNVRNVDTDNMSGSFVELANNTSIRLKSGDYTYLKNEPYIFERT
mgnify:FL=1